MPNTEENFITNYYVKNKIYRYIIHEGTHIFSVNNVKSAVRK